MIDIQTLQKALLLRGYKLFDDDSKPYNLNLIGVRSNDLTPNVFNDWFCVMWKFEGNWNLNVFKCTTDPGLYWLEKPMNEHGTAILKEGQHRGMWTRGMHQGKYPALVQAEPVTVIRDYNRDNKLDFDLGRLDAGLFGINGHRANSKWESIQVDKWSAGCQVLSNPQEFDQLITLCDESRKHWGNSFTYTLLSENDLNL